MASTETKSSEKHTFHPARLRESQQFFPTFADYVSQHLSVRSEPVCCLSAVIEARHHTSSSNCRWLRGSPCCSQSRVASAVHAIFPARANFKKFTTH